jgi:hypothetical protein
MMNTTQGLGSHVAVVGCGASNDQTICFIISAADDVLLHQTDLLNY